MEILLIDDDAEFRTAMSKALRGCGHSVASADDGNDGMRMLREHTYDLVVSDVRMPGPDGFAILHFAREAGRASDVILMTGFGAIDDAVTAMKLRATDYLVKPFAVPDLLRSVEQVEARQTANRSNPDEHDMSFVGESPKMVAVRKQIDAMGPSDAPVLITGESGTGKELVARALHERSERRGGPFVAINCASFPDTLLEAELFGYERGAFTGAEKRRKGRFAAAQGGTLFLDEIGDMPLVCQAKLLRVLQEKCFSPLGTNEVADLDVRIISATNHSLKELVDEQRFREDLYFRVKVLHIALPPLRERQGDIPLLVSHFVRRLAGELPPAVPADTWALLSHYDFPGNVRELEHTIEHAVVLARAECADEIRPEHLPEEVNSSSSSPSGALAPLTTAVKSFERQYLLRALGCVAGSRTRAAELLGISRKNLWEKLRAHGVTDDEIRLVCAASGKN